MSGKLPKRGLVVAQNVVIGYQLASLFKQQGWHMQVVHRDYSAYEVILHQKVDVVIADIDSPSLGGLAVLVYCHHHFPGTETYGVLQGDDGDLKRLARDVAGCQGFFYLQSESLQLDTSRGMATEFQPGSASV